MPKLARATAVAVFDLSKDLSAQTPAAKEAYMAILVIQGLVNRTSAEKIFLTHSPPEWGWDLPPENPRNWAADQGWLDAGLIPVPETRPPLDGTKAYPVLSYLLAHYGSHVKGAVSIPNANASASYDGAFAAAFTACGILDAVPVSTAIEAYLASDGLMLPKLADTRALSSNVAAFDWAYGNYFGAQTDRRLLGTFSQNGYGGSWRSEFPSMLDYWIANRTFVYAFDAADPAQRDRMEVLLNPQNYPYGVPVLGVLNSEGIDALTPEKLGYPTDICGMPNISVTSSFALSPSSIAAPVANAPSAIDANGAYVGFFVTDGDSVAFSSAHHFRLWTQSPSKGQTPIGWSTNVQIMDLFPTLLAYYSQNTYGQKYELVASSWHASRADGDGLAPFIDRYRFYRQNTGTLFNEVNLVPWWPEFTQAQMHAIALGAGFSVLLDGYDARTTDVVSWTFFGTPKRTHTGLSGPTQRRASVASIVASISSNVTRAPPGTPAFMTITIGDGLADHDCVADVDAAIAQILAGNDGRNYHWLKPTDVAAAWRRWKNL